MPNEKNDIQVVKSSKNPDMDTKLLDESAIDKNQKEQKFLNKRNIVLIVVFTIIAIVAVFLTFIFVIQINWYKMFESMAQGFVHQIGGLWFTLLLLGVIFSTFYNWVPIAIRIATLGHKIKFWEWVLFGFICSFIKAITPANFVVDPLTVFWLTRKGIPTNKATTLMFTNAFFWEVAQIIIKAPSFIMCMLNVQNLLFIDGGFNAGGITVLILMCLGYLIDFIGLSFMALLCLSKSVHYRLSVIFNWFRKKLHMQYHTKDEIEEKYKVRAVMKADFISYVKDAKTTIFVILTFAFFELYTYLMVNFGMSFMQYYNYNGETFYFGFNYGIMYNCSSMATTANRINIIPNGELGIEGILNVLIGSHKDGKYTVWFQPEPTWPGSLAEQDNAHKTIINNGIFLSRVFWAYFPAIIGFFTVIPVLSVYLNKKRKESKQKKLANS